LSRAKQILWDGERLPAWDDQAPPKLYALFREVFAAEARAKRGRAMAWARFYRDYGRWQMVGPAGAAGDVVVFGWEKDRTDLPDGGSWRYAGCPTSNDPEVAGMLRGSLAAAGRRAYGRARPGCRDHYCRLLMCLVKINFDNEKWVKRLPEKNLEPQDVAQDLLEFLLRKTLAFRMNRRPINKGEEWKVLIKGFNLALRRRVATLIEEAGRQEHVRPMTQVFGRAEERERRGEAKPVEAVARAEDPRVDLRRLLGAAEDAVCRPVAGDVFLVLALYRHQRHRLLKHKGLAGYAELPAWMRRRVTPTQHLQVTARLNMVLRGVVADACA